jgi:hypothetical protein
MEEACTSILLNNTNSALNSRQHSKCMLSQLAVSGFKTLSTILMVPHGTTHSKSPNDKNRSISI